MNPLRKPSLAVGAVSFLLPFAAYTFTLAPSIYPGDSPEFTAAAHALGIPHPPGYAHYVLLGKLATLLPLGNVAFRLNLLSAIGAGLSATALSLLAYRLTGKAVTAVAGGLLLAFSRDFWAQAGSAEVYTLQVLFLFLPVLLGLSVDRTATDGPLPEAGRRNRSLYFIASFLFGYATGIHYFILFALPGGLFLFARRLGWRTAARSFGTATLFAVAGWCLFLLLPVRSAAHPPLDWGETRDPVNFLTHIFWSQYSGRPSLGFSWERLGARALDLLGLFRSQWPWPAYLLVPPGLYLLWRRHRGDLLPALLLLFLVPVGSTLLLLNDPSREIFEGISSNKFLCGYAVAALLAALGACQLLEWCGNAAPRIFPGSRGRRFAVAAALLLLTFLVLEIRGNRRFADRSAALQLHAYTLNLLDPLPAGSALVTEYDVPTFPLLYLRVVEGYRGDISAYGRNGILFRTDYNAAYAEGNERLQERARALIDNAVIARHVGRVFFSNQVAPFAPDGEQPALPFGLAYTPAGDAPLPVPPDLWGKGFVTSPFRRSGGFLDHRNRELVSDMHRMAAEREIARGDTTAAKRMLEEAVRSAPAYYWVHYYGGILRYRALGDAAGGEALLRRAAEILPSEHVYGQLGIVRFGAGDYSSALGYFLRALALAPDHVPSLLNAASCYAATGDARGAEGMLGRAVQADPDDASAWLRLGQIQGDRGDYAAADRSLSRAIELAPENADAFFLRGAARMALGRPEDAERDARKALALSPGKEAFRRLLSALRGSGSRR